jgi:hypothetical protein
MGNQTELGALNGLMGNLTLVNTRKVKNMVLDSIHGQMETGMKVGIKMMLSMAEAKSNGLMVLYTMVTGSMIRLKDMVYSEIKTVISMLDNLNMVQGMDTDFLNRRT